MMTTYVPPTVVLFGKSLKPYYEFGKKSGIQQGTKADCDVFVGSYFEVGDPGTIDLEGTGVKNDVQAVIVVSGYWQLSGKAGSIKIGPGTYYTDPDLFNGPKYDTLIFLGFEPPQS
jgi:hypothetical protein